MIDRDGSVPVLIFCLDWTAANITRYPEELAYVEKLKATATTTIVAGSSRMCLGVSNSSTTSGALIVQMPCTGQANTDWTFAQAGSGYHLIARNSGMCLNVPGNSKTPNTQLIQWPCQGATRTNDQWTLAAQPSGYHLVSVSSGLCVSIAGTATSSGPPVVQSSCSAALNEQMSAQIPTGTPQRQPTTRDIVAVSSGQCVNVSNASRWGARPPMTRTPKPRPTRPTRHISSISLVDRVSR